MNLDNADVSAVVETASALHLSEIEVFRLAYRHWFGHVANDHEIHRIFSDYLNESKVPMWVRDFTRRVRRLHNAGQLDMRRFGLPPPTPNTYWIAFLGGMVFAFMLMILALLVYLANRAQELIPSGCQFPPCF